MQKQNKNKTNKKKKKKKKKMSSDRISLSQGKQIAEATSNKLSKPQGSFKLINKKKQQKTTKNNKKSIEDKRPSTSKPHTNKNKESKKYTVILSQPFF